MLAISVVHLAECDVSGALQSALIHFTQDWHPVHKMIKIVRHQSQMQPMTALQAPMHLANTPKHSCVQLSQYWHLRLQQVATEVPNDLWDI